MPALKYTAQPPFPQWSISQRWVPLGVKGLALPRSLLSDLHCPVWRCGQEEPWFVQRAVSSPAPEWPLLTSPLLPLGGQTHQMRDMQRGEKHKCVSVSPVDRVSAPLPSCARGWGGTFLEREPGLAWALGAHVTPPCTPHFSRELPKPKQLRMGLRVLGGPMERDSRMQPWASRRKRQRGSAEGTQQHRRRGQ